MAFWVLIGHWSTTADIPVFISKTKLYNGYAVDVFIILSGFAITSLIMKRPEPYPLYLTRRFFRIFPVYLLYLALSVALSRVALETWSMISDIGYMNGFRVQIAESSLAQFRGHLLAHVLALHGLVPTHILPDGDFAFLGQAWSISLEWQFYLLAPLTIAVVIKPGFRSISVALAICAALTLWSDHGPFDMPVGFLGYGRHLTNFYIGIVSAAVLDRVFRGTLTFSPTANRILIGVGWICTVMIVFNDRFIPLAIWCWALWVILNAHVGRAGLCASVSGFLNGPAAQWLGQRSYSIYLSHMIVIVLSVRALYACGLRDGVLFSVGLLVLIIPGTLALSTLSYRYIEMPFHNYGRKIGRDPVSPAQAK